MNKDFWLIFQGFQESPYVEDPSSSGGGATFLKMAAAILPVMIVSQVALKALNSNNHSLSWRVLRLGASSTIGGVVTYLSYQTIQLVFPFVPIPPPLMIVASVIVCFVKPIFDLLLSEIVVALLGASKYQFDLGRVYEEGDLGVEANPPRAVEMYERAADQNHAEAQFRLGNCYEHGIGVAVNKHIAVQYYTQAADQNHAEAQFRLGNCYEHGIGVAVNKHIAVQYYTQAADQEHAGAQNQLGVCYEQGIGVQANLRTAIAWYRRAAALNNADARNHLIRLHAH